MESLAAVNALADLWARAMLRSLVDSTILLFLLLAIWWPLRRRIPSQAAYFLFLLVLLKAALPIPIALPGRLLPGSPSEYLLAADRASPSLPSSEPFADPLDEFLGDSWPAPPPALSPATESSAEILPEPAPSLPARPTPGLSALGYLMLAWASIASFLLGRFAFSNFRLMRDLRRAPALDPSSLPIDYALLCRRVRLRRPPPIVVAPGIGSPAVWGLARPRLLLPAGLADDLPPAQLAWVLLHELIHLRRLDLWVATTQRLVQIVYFFHPAVWASNRLIDLHREYACDDAALALAPDLPRRACAAGFLAVIERSNAAAATSPALGLFRSQTHLRSRLMRILDPHLVPLLRLPAWAILPLLLVALATLPYVRAGAPAAPVAPAVAQEPPPPVPSPSPAKEIESLVLHAGTDQPLAGAQVEVRFSRSDWRPDAVATTDATGRCKHTIPPGYDPEILVFVASKEGFASSMAAPLTEVKTLDEVPPQTLRLVPGEPIRLRVQNEQGRPIAGAMVTLGSMLPGQDRSNLRDIYVTSLTASPTDADGLWTTDRFPTTIPPAGLVTFGVTHPDYSDVDVWSSRLSLPASQLRDGSGVLTLKQGTPVAGRVVDGSGQPIAGATIELISRFSGATPTTQSNVAGQFLFPHPPESRAAWELRVSKAGFTPVIQTVEASVERQSIRLSPSSPFRARVIDTSGQPVADAIVQLANFAGHDTWNWQARTDAEGWFTWPAAPRFGQATFSFRKRPFHPATRLLTFGTEPTVTLHSPVRVRGKVVDSRTGEPIDQFRIYSLSGSSPSESLADFPPPQHQGLARTGGSFDEPSFIRDTGFPASLWVTAEGYIPAALHGLSASAGEINHDFALSPAAIFSGTVLDPDGTPASGAIVALTNSGRSLPSFIDNSNANPNGLRDNATEAGADGRYHLTQLAEAAPGLLVVSKQGHAQLTPDQLAGSADVRLTPNSRVAGICLIGNRPLKNEPIRLHLDNRTPHPNTLSASYDTHTDAEGRFTFEGVLPGWACITSINRDGRPTFLPITSKPFEVKPGEATRIQLGGVGRPVIGKLALPPDTPHAQQLLESAGLGIATPAPPMTVPTGFLGWDYARQKAFVLAFSHSTGQHSTIERISQSRRLKVEPDGTFRAEDVLPGSYAIQAHFRSEPLTRERQGEALRATSIQEYTVPPMPTGSDKEPLDIGTVELSIEQIDYKRLSPGEPAPDFSATTLDGHPLRLSDLRGKWVLLQVTPILTFSAQWDWVSMEAVRAAHGDDPRLAIVSLHLEGGPASARQIVANWGVQWTQAIVEPPSRSKVQGSYLRPFTNGSTLQLISPAGQVLAVDLSDRTALLSTVAEALQK